MVHIVTAIFCGWVVRCERGCGVARQHRLSDRSLRWRRDSRLMSLTSQHVRENIETPWPKRLKPMHGRYSYGTHFRTNHGSAPKPFEPQPQRHSVGHMSLRQAPVCQNVPLWTFGVVGYCIPPYLQRGSHRLKAICGVNMFGMCDSARRRVDPKVSGGLAHGRRCGRLYDQEPQLRRMFEMVCRRPLVVIYSSNVHSATVKLLICS